jgi:hypothetical protein
MFIYLSLSLSLLRGGGGIYREPEAAVVLVEAAPRAAASVREDPQRPVGARGSAREGGAATAAAAAAGSWVHSSSTRVRGTEREARPQVVELDGVLVRDGRNKNSTF